MSIGFAAKRSPGVAKAVEASRGVGANRKDEQRSGSKTGNLSDSLRRHHRIGVVFPEDLGDYEIVKTVARLVRDCLFYAV